MRPRKPTELKKLQGTYQKCRDINEIKFTILENEIEIQKDWQKILQITCEQLRKIGILAEVDLNLVEAYAKAMSRYYEAQAQVEAMGMVIDGQAGLKVNPWFDVMEKSLKTACNVGGMFGITPSARARIPAQAAPASKLELLKKKIS